VSVWWVQSPGHEAVRFRREVRTRVAEQPEAKGIEAQISRLLLPLQLGAERQGHAFAFLLGHAALLAVSQGSKSIVKLY
jgi:hypothetical protein